MEGNDQAARAEDAKHRTGFYPPIRGETMARGALTDEIQQLANEFLGRPIATVELRLYPYLDYLMKNEQKINPQHINGVDRDTLQILREEGHIEGGASGLSMTKEFYDYINQVLWYGYVVDAYTGE